MRDREPTVRSRKLGEGLRRAMERAGLNGKQATHVPAGHRAGCRGCCRASAVDIAAFLGGCRVKSPERDRLLALRQEQNTPGWLQQHSTRLPKQLVTLIDQEKLRNIRRIDHSALALDCAAEPMPVITPRIT